MMLFCIREALTGRYKGKGIPGKRKFEQAPGGMKINLETVSGSIGLAAGLGLEMPLMGNMFPFLSALFPEAGMWGS